MHDTSEVARRLEAIRGRIATASARSGRRTDAVTLVGASKSQPVERLRSAFDAGLRDFGENRVQEAQSKRPHLPTEIRWSLLGPLQSNKVNKAVELFSTVHSVDREKIARALDRSAGEHGRRIEGFLEVNLAHEPSKSGFAPEGFVERVAPLVELSALRIVGLMAVPPFDEPEDAARRWFRELRALRDELFSRSAWSDRPGWLSMGMSSDFEIAIEEGATHVRIGSDLFGPRSSLLAGSEG